MEVEEMRLGASKHSPAENGDELKYFMYASIISADNDEFTEDQKQEVIRRFDLEEDVPFDDKDWKFILEPVDKDDKLLKLFK
jgi:hypothetical protein